MAVTYVTTTSAARILGLTPKGVRWQIRKKWLKAERVGHAFLIKESDVRALKAQRDRAQAKADKAS